MAAEGVPKDGLPNAEGVVDVPNADGVDDAPNAGFPNAGVVAADPPKAGLPKAVVDGVPNAGVPVESAEPKAVVPAPMPWADVAAEVEGVPKPLKADFELPDPIPNDPELPRFILPTPVTSASSSMTSSFGSASAETSSADVIVESENPELSGFVVNEGVPNAGVTAEVAVFLIPVEATEKAVVGAENMELAVSDFVAAEENPKPEDVFASVNFGLPSALVLGAAVTAANLKSVTFAGGLSPLSASRLKPPKEDEVEVERIVVATDVVDCFESASDLAVLSVSFVIAT